MAKILKSEGLTAQSFAHAKTLIQSLANSSKRQIIYSVMVEQCGNLFVIVCFLCLSVLHLGFGVGTGGEFIFQLLLIQRAASFFTNFQMKRRNMGQKFPSYESCMKLIENIPESHMSKGSTLPDIEKGIVFKDVSFAYPDGSQILKGIDLRLPERGLVAISGKSGSGKTTLIDMFLGLLEPSKGEVLIGDVSMKEIDQKAWHDLITYVPQDSYLFNDSLRKTLSFGIDNAGDEDLWAVLEKVGLRETIEKLQDGLDTNVLSGGFNFSGGEKQRLLIARAILKNTRILVMDEPSSSLDKASEQILKNQLQTLSADMLIIVISHSPEFMEAIDNLVVLDQGELRSASSQGDDRSSAGEKAVGG